MAMNEADLAQKIKDVMNEIRTEQDNPDGSMNSFAEKLAKAIVDEVKKIKIVATAPNGPVTVVSIN